MPEPGILVGVAGADGVFVVGCGVFVVGFKVDFAVCVGVGGAICLRTTSCGVGVGCRSMRMLSLSSG